MRTSGGLLRSSAAPTGKPYFLCTAEVALEDMPGLLKDPRDARTKCKGWIEAVEGIEVPGAGRP